MISQPPTLQTMSKADINRVPEMDAIMRGCAYLSSFTRPPGDGSPSAATVILLDIPTLQWCPGGRFRVHL